MTHHHTCAAQDNDELIQHPDQIAGYSYGTEHSACSPLTLEDLEQLKQAVGLTAEDDQALRMAAEVLGGQADEMVSAWRARLGEFPHLACYSAHPDGSPNTEYSAASKPRFDRWIIDACTRPLDAAWLDYQHEIGLRHTRERKNVTDGADSIEHIPMRYLLAFTAVVITTSRDFLTNRGHNAHDVERMHAAFTKSVMLHVTVWTRAYVDPTNW